ncbi:MAG: two-component regulator propeller domain-containing protein [Saprospiraceae bacterium]
MKVKYGYKTFFTGRAGQAGSKFPYQINKTWLLLLVFFLVKIDLPAQNFAPARIAPVTGLSEKNVNCITQDRQGFIWVGTRNGLNRFDGYQFKYYKNQQDNPLSLSNNTINAIAEDREGFLWVATSNGLNSFDPSNNTFQQFHHDDKNPKSIASGQVHSIFEDQEGNLWFGASTMLDKLDRATGEFTHYQPPTAPPAFANDNAVMTITELGNDLFIGTWGEGIWRFHKQDQRFERVHLESEEQENLRWARRVWAAPSGELFATVNDILFKYDVDRALFLKLPFPQYGKFNLTTAFHKISTDQWLVGTSGMGLKVYNQDFSQSEEYPIESDSSLANYNSVNVIFRDNCGLFWIGTRGNGLYTFDLDRKKFQGFDNEGSHSAYPQIKDITHVLETQSGEIWVANKNQGVFYLDSISHRLTHVTQKQGVPEELAISEAKVLFQDSKKRIWIGTWGYGLVMWNPTGQQVLQFTNDSSSERLLSDNFITSICESKDGRIWVSTTNGVSVIEPEGDKIYRRFLYKNGQPDGLSHPRADVVFCGHDGQIWMGTSEGGLNRYDANQDTFHYYLHDPNDPGTLGSNSVISLFEDHTDHLWVGTYGGGLHRLDADHNSFSHFKEKDGLPSDIIMGITEGPAGILWVSTDKGLSKFDTQNGTFSNYFEQDGLLGNQFNERAICASKHTGEIYLGGIGGVSYFHPDSIHTNPFVPPVVISSIKKYVTEGTQTYTVDIERTAEVDHITVPFSQNTLTFEFAALNFRQPYKNQYAYKLEGLGKNWSDLGTKREVTFGNLPSGKYTLWVKASNNDGIWNEQPISLKIYVLAPWYRTWWAYLIYTLAAAGLIFFMRKKELKEQQLQHQLELEQVEAEKLKEVDQLKSRFFTNISHEFRTPLTLILGQVESAKERINDMAVQSKLEMAFRNGKRLLQLINQLLDLSKLESGNMQLHTEQKDLLPFLKNLYYSFGSLAEQQKISLDFQCDRPSLPLFFDEIKLEKVFFNLLSNAIKFTPEGGKITLLVERADGRTSPPSPPQGGTTVSANHKVLPFSRGISPLEGGWGVNPFFVKITVRDTGIGIPADRLPFVFGRFYQVDSSRTKEQEGTGIGLALVKEFVELHHGQVSVESQIGVGTAFTVFLPFGEESGNAKVEQVKEDVLLDREKDFADIEPIKTTTKNGHSPKTAQLLIVEDNDDVRHYLRGNLEEAGYQVMEAINGEEGLSIAQEHLPDLILTDVMMPRMDGYEFSRRIRSDERTSHIPLIILTAKAEEKDKIEGLEIGVDDYLTKPFSSRELLTRVANLIRLRRQLRERFSTATVIRPTEVSPVSVDQKFLEKVLKTIEARLGDEQFAVEPLSEAVNMSVTHLNRKLNALIGQSAGNLIRSMRLQRAAELLTQNSGTVKEIAFEVGFNTPENFSRSFKKQFGAAPGEYQKQAADVQK